MAFTLPFGIRLAAGLLGTAIDRATTLPTELPSLAVTLAGQALRTSMRVQQELAELATRGDELLAPLTGRATEHPEWATFDEDEDDSASPAPRRPAPGRSAARAGDGGEPAVPLPGGMPVAGFPDPDAAGPGEAVPTAAGFVVGATSPTEALTAPPTASLVEDTSVTEALIGRAPASEALVGGMPGEVVVSDITDIIDIAPPAVPVANARRTTARARGRSVIKSDHKLTIAELKERTQQMSVAEVRALLAQEEAGPNRAAYLTLLGNRLMTLQHEDR